MPEVVQHCHQEIRFVTVTNMVKVHEASPHGENMKLLLCIRWHGSFVYQVSLDSPWKGDILKSVLP